MWVWWLVACGGDGAPPPGPDPATPTGDSAPRPPTLTASTAATGATGSTADTAEPVDCGAIPGPPFTTVRLDTVVAVEDFAFDDHGNLVGASVGAFLRQPYPPGKPEVFGPYPAGVDAAGIASIRTLPGGDLIYDGLGAVSVGRVDDTTGAHTLISGSLLYPNGIDVHSGGWAYVADLTADEVWRIDPDTLAAEVVVSSLDSPNGVALDLAEDTLYIGMRDAIHRVELDATGRPTGPPEVFVEVPPALGILAVLGLEVDACGNVYACFITGHVLRFPETAAPDDVGELVLEIPGGFPTNAQFGRGLGGWADDHLFVFDRFAGFYEVDVGVPGTP